MTSRTRTKLTTQRSVNDSHQTSMRRSIEKLVMLKRHHIEETCYPIQLRACSTTARRVYWPSRRERPLDCLLSAGLGRLRSDEKSNHQTSNPAYSSFRCAILLETHQESLALLSRTLSGSQTAGPRVLHCASSSQWRFASRANPVNASAWRMRLTSFRFTQATFSIKTHVRFTALGSPCPRPSPQ